MPDVADSYDDHESEQGSHADEVDQSLAFGLESLTSAQDLDQDQDDATTVKGREWQDVHDCEAEAQNGGQTQDGPPALVRDALRDLAGYFDDTDWTGDLRLLLPGDDHKDTLYVLLGGTQCLLDTFEGSLPQRDRKDERFICTSDAEWSLICWWMQTGI